jgi:hypothetical protein
MEIDSFDSWLNNSKMAHNAIEEAVPADVETFGGSLGIDNKDDHLPLASPKKGPIGDLTKSAYANINVPTRSIKNATGTITAAQRKAGKSEPKPGGLGCVAALSLMFYRATGYPIIPGKPIIQLGTATLWDHLSSDKKNWQMIRDWKTSSKPGDVILTATNPGHGHGHTGIIVDNGKIISNSSNGMPPSSDNTGQIEMNYKLSTWKNIEKNNPQKTAAFRYIGPIREEWDGEAIAQQKEAETKAETKVKSKSKLKSRSSIKHRKYYRIRYKDQRITKIAKYNKSEHKFDLYSKRRDLIGSIRKTDDDRIIEDGNDITGTDIGNIYARLFKLAEQGKPISSKKTKDFITVPSTKKTIKSTGAFNVLPGNSSEDQKATKGAQIATKLIADFSLTKEQAAGFAGNLWEESGFYPARVQHKPGSVVKPLVIDGKTGYSWSQWTHDSRQISLKNHAKSKFGVDLTVQPANDDIAYSFLAHELKTTHKGALNNLRKSTDVKSATHVILNQYEQPHDRSEAALNKRANHANRVLAKMGGSDLMA